MKKIVFMLLAVIYLQTWAVNDFELDNNEIAILEAIACQDPLAGGDAVYSARVLLGIEFTCPNYNKTAGNTYEPRPDKDEIPMREEPFISKIYPNPNNGKMQLDYILEDGREGIVEIFDISGKLLNNYKLEAGNNTLTISEGSLRNGVYFYKVIVDDSVVRADKLVIIK